jgi:hypothetical protein
MVYLSVIIFPTDCHFRGTPAIAAIATAGSNSSLSLCHGALPTTLFTMAWQHANRGILWHFHEE